MDDQEFRDKVVGHIASTKTTMESINTHIQDQKLITKDLYSKVGKDSDKVNKFSGAFIIIGVVWTYVVGKWKGF